MNVDDRIRWGILGCGSIATHAVAPAIRWSQNGTIDAVASRVRSRADQKAAEIGAKKAYEGYEALLADPEIDAVYIGLPNGEHFRWALAAAQYGKHVLCEKSLALSLQDARRLRAEFSSKDLIVVEAFMIRHHPQWSKVREVIDSGEIGDVVSVRAGLAGNLESDSDHRFSASLGGGALFDVTCYGVNCARFVLGREPLRVKASARLAASGVDQASHALIDFGDGRIAEVYGSLRSPVAEQYVVIVGTKGRIVMDRPFVPHFDKTLIVVEREHASRSIEVAGANHFLHQVEHFADLVRRRRTERFPSEDGVANVAVCEAIRLAYERGETVDVESIG